MKEAFSVEDEGVGQTEEEVLYYAFMVFVIMTLSLTVFQFIFS